MQSAARSDRLESQTRSGFADMRARLDRTAAGHEQIVRLDHIVARLDGA